MANAGRRPIALMTLAALVVAAGAVWLGVTTGQAATSLPADKMSVIGSDVETMAPGEDVSLLGPTRMRTSSTEDLIFQVTAECSLTTNVTTIGNDDSRAFGQVRVWVTVDGKEVAVAPGNSNGRVVFCNRAYQRTTEGFDDEDATIKTFFSTREANGFNWVKLNLGNGIHTIEVRGELTKEATANATAMAAVGNRTLVVEPTKAAHNETLGP
jgi:hypothetical protein